MTLVVSLQYVCGLFACTQLTVLFTDVCDVTAGLTQRASVLHPGTLTASSVLGMTLFGGKFCNHPTEKRACTCAEINSPDVGCKCARKNFDSLLWSLVTVFQVNLQGVYPPTLVLNDHLQGKLTGIFTPYCDP